MDTNGAASKTSCPGNRPQLTLKQALAAVREGIDPEAPETLKAAIFSRLKDLKPDGGSGAVKTVDWDHFLAICTQEYRKARCITLSQPNEKSSGKFRNVVQFARLIRQTWEISIPEAFEKFQPDSNGVLSAENFRHVATNELGLKESKVDDIWSLLDAEQKGHVQKEEWELLDVSDEADDPEEEPIFPAGWDDKLSPEESEKILQEAQQVAARLAASLEEHGETANENEVLGWALRSVLQRKGLKNRPQSTPGLQPQVSHTYASLEQMGEAYGQSAVAGDDSKGLEDTVRQHLGSATRKLVDEALHEANPAEVPELEAVKEALLQEFLVVTDALMEALVTEDFNAWIQHLKISEVNNAQQQNFEDLTREFQELLGADQASTQGLVAHVLYCYSQHSGSARYVPSTSCGVVGGAWHHHDAGHTWLPTGWWGRGPFTDRWCLLRVENDATMVLVRSEGKHLMVVHWLLAMYLTHRKTHLKWSLVCASGAWQLVSPQSKNAQLFDTMRVLYITSFRMAAIIWVVHMHNQSSY